MPALFLRTLILAALALPVVYYDIVVIQRAAEQLGDWPSLIFVCLSPLIGFGIILGALVVHGRTIIRNIRLYRANRGFYAPDYASGKAIRSVTKLTIAGALIAIPGLITDTLGILILVVEPLGIWTSNLVLAVLNPDLFSHPEERW